MPAYIVPNSASFGGKVCALFAIGCAAVPRRHWFNNLSMSEPMTVQLHCVIEKGFSNGEKGRLFPIRSTRSVSQGTEVTSVTDGHWKLVRLKRAAVECGCCFSSILSLSDENPLGGGEVMVIKNDQQRLLLRSCSRIASGAHEGNETAALLSDGILKEENTAGEGPGVRKSTCHLSVCMPRFLLHSQDLSEINSSSVERAAGSLSVMLQDCV
ncbi:hypothetical protein DPX16_14496 [Anabarilius grahami]|uniref:Uncharacterized protein n=1 Tax=Anabarilius grahami TaxID=495550 RepID=A0A3N0YXC4_ANAGA|nr:hypothetical protein DPX16_14496 [Anabarilius grahami]